MFLLVCRLSAFGFMVTYKGNGNYGIMDQIQALKWVRTNIRKFGGDPDRVTVMGHGAGATCVSALMTSPQAKGLFQGAVMMSAGPHVVTSLEEARARDLERAQNVTGCPDETCLLRYE